MARREWQVGIVGTFDLENYGDLLFPLIAETELRERLGEVRLHRFSYHAKSAAAWPYAVTSLVELPALAPQLDALLVGGGYLLRFDAEVAPGYGPPTPAIHHPSGYWLTPMLVALQHDVPVIWNGLGMHHDVIPDWADPLLELALRSSALVAVRDATTQSALTELANDAAVTVIPDTAFGLEKTLARDAGAGAAAQRELDAIGLRAPYLVIQASDSMVPMARFLRRHAAELGALSVLALPIGPVLGDAATNLAAALPTAFSLRHWPAPLVLAEIVRRAVAVAGQSYHLTITALAAGLPVFNPAALTGKYSVFDGASGFWPPPLADDPDPRAWLSRLGRGAPATEIATATACLAGYWDRVAEIVRQRPTGGAEALGRFLQRLPLLLEAPPDAAAPLAALRAQLGTLAQRLDIEMKRRVEAERRIAELLDSTSWRATAPLRYLGRGLNLGRGRRRRP